MWEISNGPNEPQNGDAVPGEAERNWAIKKDRGRNVPGFCGQNEFVVFGMGGFPGEMNYS